MLVSSLLLVMGSVQLQGPIAYFEDRCSRCHGSMGSMYDLKLLASRSKKKLEEDIKRMAEGPAQAPLVPADVQRQVQLHQAMASSKPYIFVFPAKGRRLTGEVTAGSTVRVAGQGKTVQARVNGFAWSADLPKGFVPLKVVAGLGKATTTLVLRK